MVEKEGSDFKPVTNTSFNLWVHDERFSTHEVIINLEYFPNIKENDLISIHPTEEAKNDVFGLGNSLIVKVTNADKEILSKQPLLQVNWQSVSADYIEFTFKDQYLSRSDMWRIKSSLLKSCVYKGQKVLYAGCIRVQAQVSCGFVSPETKIVFRSESARSFVFIQMSSEIWHFEEDGYTYSEKLILGFLTDLFEKWTHNATNHVITLILFSRVLYDEQEYQILKEQDEEVYVDCNGLYYKDFYKVLVEWETLCDWLSLIPLIKNESIYFRKYLLEFDNGKIARHIGKISWAKDGNFLEIINVALNEFDKHYVDRDLIRTGQQIVIITPGNGYFKVDKNMLRLTFERLDDCGLFLELVCLSKKPIHITPLLEFKTFNLSQTSPIHKYEKVLSADGLKSSKTEDNKLEHKNVLFTDITEDDSGSAQYIYYAVPYWINTSFYDSDKISYKRPGQFSPCIKMRSLQRVGIYTNTKIFDHIPFLVDPNIIFTQQKLSFESELNDESMNSDESLAIITDPVFDFNAYDEQVFQASGNKSLNIMGLGKSFTPKESAINEASKRKNLSAAKALIQEQTSDNYFKDNIQESATAEGLNVPIISQSLPKTTIIRRKSSLSNLILNEKGIILSNKVSENHDDSTSSFKNEKISSADKLVTSSKPINIKLNKDYFVPKSSPKQSTYVSRRNSPTKELQRLSFKSPPKASNNSFVDHQFFTNPFSSIKISSLRPAMAGRWQHILSHQPLLEETKWESLCIPPCLPITTSYFPSWEELSHCYEEYNYTVSPNYDINDEIDEKISINKTTKDLLEELICQRLAQGFQIVTFDHSPNINTKPGKLGSGHIISSDEAPSIFDKIPNKDFSTVPIPCYLTSGNHIHRLMYDSTGQNVEIKRFARKITYSTSPIKYVANIWTKTASEYKNNVIEFNYPKLNAYNWNYLDHLISGYQDEMNESLRFWRARFVLLPGDINTIPSGFLNENMAHLDEEELRLSGFCKFLEQFQKVCLHSDSETQNDTSTHINGLDIKFTTFTPSGYVASEFNGNHSMASSKRGYTFNEKLSKESKISTILSLLKHPTNGVRLSDRRWHVKLYVNVFVGNEFVDWCLKSFNDIKSRDEAVQFGNQLMGKGVIEHCLRKHPFLDGHYFYGLKPGMGSIKKNKNSWFKYNRSIPANSSEASSSLTQLLSNFALNSDLPSGIKMEQGHEDVKMVLSKRMMINLDINKKSSKREIAFLHYDTLFNPKHCYHFQIYWLGCTARLIDDLLQTWSRVAEKCGLKLIEAPFYQTLNSSQESPFKVPLTIEFASKPLNTIEICNQFNLHPIITNGIPIDYFVEELARYFDFILDIESDPLFPPSFNRSYSYLKPRFGNTQYIHKNGIMILQLLPDHRGFLLETNRIYFNSSNQNYYKNSQDTNIELADQLQTSIIQFCSSQTQLREFWSLCSEKLKTRSGLEGVLENLPSLILSALDDQFPVVESPLSPEILSDPDQKKLDDD